MTFLKRLLIGLYASFILYISLVLVLGDFGMAEKRRLDNYQGVLNANLQELESINLSLQEKASSLRKEADTLQIYARNLDYYGENEGVIIVEGRKNTQNSYTMGRMLSWNRKVRNNTGLFRILSACFGIITFLLLTLFFPGEKNGSVLQ